MITDGRELLEEAPRSRGRAYQLIAVESGTGLDDVAGIKEECWELSWHQYLGIEGSGVERLEVDDRNALAVASKEEVFSEEIGEVV
ncbi:hypothetical protein L1887_32065 [Cichorium endivia]|nr:hypothetical protein L1887_32065 [Cichorium endivia]